MNYKRSRIAIVIALACAVTVNAFTTDSKKEDKQKQIRKMSQDTLQRLYKAKPSTKAAVERAAGYAVFSDFGVKILVAGSGKGQGVAVNNKSKQETFMKMLELQAGLGFGVKKFKVVFIFDTGKALDHFINSGWEFGGESSVAAKTGDKGGALEGAVAVSDGVWMYQLTDKGVAADITVKSSKYYKDDDLN